MSTYSRLNFQAWFAEQRSEALPQTRGTREYTLHAAIVLTRCTPSSLASFLTDNGGGGRERERYTRKLTNRTKSVVGILNRILRTVCCIPSVCTPPCHALVSFSTTGFLCACFRPCPRCCDRIFFIEAGSYRSMPCSYMATRKGPAFWIIQLAIAGRS